MLTDKTKELLCRAVDGDLDDRQRRTLQQLLLESEEARVLFHRLRQDAQRLREMSRKQLPASFAGEVLKSIDHKPSIMPAALAKTAQQYLPIWANVAAALAILVAVSVGTYLVVSMDQQQKAAHQVAEKKHPATAPSVTPKPDTTPSPEIARGTPKLSSPDIAQLPMPREDEVPSVPLSELPEAPEPESKAVLTAQFNRALDLFKVEMPKLPPILVVRELDKAINKTTLRDSLKGDDAVHLDLFCKDANKGFERVLAVLRGQGSKVLVETLAQKRLQAKVKTDYVIFAETLTAEDVVKLFAALAAEESKTELSQIERLVAVPMSATNQKMLATLLGVDPKQLNLKPKPPEKPDPSKPISDATAEKLKALAEKQQPGVKPADGAVLALSYNPVRPNPVLSKEVREFVAGRKDRRPGTVAVMLVIRNID
jgi:hypothetical protein